MENRVMPEADNSNEGCLNKFPKPIRAFMAAVVLRPQNYWMTEEMRDGALKELGFRIDETGRIFEVTDGTAIDTDQALKDGKEMLEK